MPDQSAKNFDGDEVHIDNENLGTDTGVTAGDGSATTSPRRTRVRVLHMGDNDDAAITSDANGTVIGFLRGLVKWAYERMPAALGQTTKSGSIPITIASDEDIVQAEDAAHTTGDKGIMLLAVRQDSATALAGTDGDYIPVIVDDNGRVHIAPAPANDGVDIGDVDVTSVVPGTGATNLGKAEDAAHSTGDVGVAAMSVRQDAAAALAGTDGDYQPVITDASGRMWVNVGAQPVRDNATDTITASLDTAAIMNDTTALTPQYAVIDDASSGDNTVIAAVAGKKIRVLALNYIVAGAVTARWEDGAGGTALTGQYEHQAAGEGIVLPFNPVGWFETSANTLLNLELSGAISVDGSITYVEV